MRKFSRYLKFFTDSKVRFYVFQTIGIYNRLSDKDYLLLVWKHKMNYPISLSDPKTFNEKTQWLKLRDHNPKYVDMVDKYEVKKYISKRFGSDFVIPTLASWDNPDDIEFDKLPEKYVLKCNHNSGRGMYICQDNRFVDKRKVIKELKKGMKQDYYLENREWPYKNVKKRIICEQYITDESGTELKDYKIFVFNGEPAYIEVDYDRFVDHHRNFYDINWNYVPFTTRYPTDPNRQINKPLKLTEMLDIAKTIACDLGKPPFLRVDLYVIKKDIKFGEITFYHGAGNEWFYPQEYDRKLGEMIRIKGE